MPLNSKQLAFRLWRGHLQRHWPIYVLGALSVALTNVTLVLWTRGLGWFLDFFSGKPVPEILLRGDREQTFYFLFALLLASRVILFIGRMGWRFTLARQTHHAGRWLKAKIYQHARFFKRYDLDSVFTKGVLMNASTSDVNAGRFIFGFTLIAVADVAFLGAMALWAMFEIHPEMALWSISALLVVPFLVKKLSSMEIERYQKAQEFLSTFNDLASQVVSTIRLQRLTQTGSFWRRRLIDTAEEYRQKRLKAVYTSLAYLPVMGGASFVSYLVLFVLGLQYVLAGSMTVGDFVAMQGLIFLLQDPLFELGFIISDFQKGGKSLQRLSEVYLHPREDWLTNEKTAEVVDRGEEILSAENLSFTYESAKEASTVKTAQFSAPVIDGLNLKVRRGERLGIKGPIGAGKSTLVQLLSGLERRHQGRIQFLGEPFEKYSHPQLRDYIGMVSQKPFLFAASIRENVAMDAELSDERIWHFLEVAGLADDVRGFAEQLDTPLGEWGINLSGGQKQRLTLARAIARRPRLLFLDDCLSAVDTVTEEKILRRLDEELAETTLVWVAHRDSTLKYCDRVLEMRKESHVDH